MVTSVGVVVVVVPVPVLMVVPEPDEPPPPQADSSRASAAPMPEYDKSVRNSGRQVDGQERQAVRRQIHTDVWTGRQRPR